jgi:hypothetical protein
VDRTFRSSEHSEAKEDLEQTGDYKEDNHLNILSIRVWLEDSPTFQGWLISAACPTPLLFRLLVALLTVRDLLLRAKDLFIAAVVAV